jgi:uncharacterized membrane protein
LRSKWFRWLIVLLVLGWADSVYLIYHHYQVTLFAQETASFCVINEVIDCDLVAMGFGSTLFGVPVATLGMFAYMYLLIIFVTERLMRPKLYPHMYCVIYVIVVVMVFFAAYEAFLSFVIIKAVCIMCVALYVMTALMMVCCKRALTPMSGEIIKTLYRLFSPKISWPHVVRLGLVLFFAFIVTAAIAYGTDRYLDSYFKEQAQYIFLMNF